MIQSQLESQNKQISSMQRRLREFESLPGMNFFLFVARGLRSLCSLGRQIVPYPSRIVLSINRLSRSLLLSFYCCLVRVGSFFLNQVENRYNSCIEQQGTSLSDNNDIEDLKSQ